MAVSRTIRMRHFLRRFFSRLLALGLGASAALNAQSPATTKQAASWPPLQVIDVEKGLPQSFVSGVVVDSDGFIWVGTQDGLARYDGRHFVVFPHVANDPFSPIDNVIGSIWKGTGTDLWIHYATGDIDRMDTRTGRCWHLTRQPAFSALKSLPLPVGSQLKADQQGRLWIVLFNDGLVYCDLTRMTLTHLRRSTHGLASDTVKAVTVDAKQRLWAVTMGGMSLLNPVTGRFSTISYPVPLKPSNGYAAAGVNELTVLVRSTGELLFGDRQKLFIFDPDRRTFRFSPLPLVPNGSIIHLAKSPAGAEYLECAGTVFRYTDQQGLTPVWQYQPTKDNLSTGLWCTGMSIDHAGVLWLGGNTLGLLRLDLAALPLHAYAYQAAFCQDVAQQGLGSTLR